jgi:hypothetical protein
MATATQSTNTSKYAAQQTPQQDRHIVYTGARAAPRGAARRPTRPQCAPPPARTPRRRALTIRPPPLLGRGTPGAQHSTTPGPEQLGGGARWREGASAPAPPPPPAVPGGRALRATRAPRGAEPPAAAPPSHRSASTHTRLPQQRRYIVGCRQARTKFCMHAPPRAFLLPGLDGHDNHVRSYGTLLVGGAINTSHGVCSLLLTAGMRL